MTPGISAVIIAKNEEDRIGNTLVSLQFCDEIIVIDSKSQDETVSICKSHGARVIQQEFLGYASQKNFGFSKAEYEWILSVDADEVVSPGLAKEIVEVIAGKEIGINAYSLKRKNFFLGNELKYGRESKDFLIRLFRNGFGRYEDSEVHEVMRIQGKISSLKEPLMHYTYRSLKHAQEKMQKYATLGAQQLEQKGVSRPLFLIVLYRPIYFIKHFILHGNIWNGKTGWQWSKLMANYHTLKYRILLQNNSKVKID